MVNKTAIFDASNYIYANYHIQKRFGHSDESIAMKTGDQIVNIMIRNFKGKTPILALDSNHYFRKDIYSGYKEKRMESPFDKSIVHDILSKRFRTIEVHGLEADDVIFIYTRQHPDAVIVSEDNDMLLMLQDGRQLWKKSGTITLNYVGTRFHRVYKIIDGCSSDNVPKIKNKGLGKVTLRKFINEYKLLNSPVDDILSCLFEKQLISDYQQNIELVDYRMSTYEKYFDFSDWESDGILKYNQ